MRWVFPQFALEHIGTRIISSGHFSGQRVYERWVGKSCCTKIVASVLCCRYTSFSRTWLLLFDGGRNVWLFGGQILGVGCVVSMRAFRVLVSLKEQTPATSASINSNEARNILEPDFRWARHQRANSYNICRSSGCVLMPRHSERQSTSDGAMGKACAPKGSEGKQHGTLPVPPNSWFLLTGT